MSDLGISLAPRRSSSRLRRERQQYCIAHTCTLEVVVLYRGVMSLFRRSRAKIAAAYSKAMSRV
jgi:hypothetical protein